MLGGLVFLVAIFTVQGIDLIEMVQDLPEKCIPDVPMIDASGKFPTSLETINLVDLGSFDACLNVENTTHHPPIKGQYCLVKIHLPPELLNASSSFPRKFDILNRNFESHSKEAVNLEGRMIAQGIDPTDTSPGIVLGWCVPHTCPIAELTDALPSVLEKISKDLKITPLMGGMCQTKESIEVEFDTSSIIFITFLAATLFLMVISTAYDVYIQHKKRRPAHIILIAFSVKTNGQKLLSVSNHPDQLGCLNGIRFLSMMWVIYGHRFSAIVMGPLMNLSYIGEWINKPINMYILNAPVSVDSFLLLSGVLVGYLYSLSQERKIKFNIILYYIHRYLRLTPVFAVVIWFHATILEYFASGPFWPFILKMMFKDYCVDNWWAALLYIQNYYNNLTMCVIQTWYLSVDMQLFILSPIILIPLWRWPKITLITSGILVLGSVASSFAISYDLDLPAFTIDTMARPDYMTKYYYTTHTRFGPWLMGLMLGYYLFILKKNKNNRISLHPSGVAFGWIVALGLLLSVLFAGHDLMMHPTRLGNTFFNGFHRHGWALGLCWVIFACTQGYGGPVNSFLSWSVFQVLGRFTYTIYLVHLTMMYTMTASSRTSTYFTNFQIIHLFWGDFALSLVISLCLTLAYESPMITIEKLLFRTGRKSAEPKLPVHNGANSEGGQTNKSFTED